MAAFVHSARKRAATNAAKIRAQRAAARDDGLLEEDCDSTEEDSLLWGPLPAAETFLKSGWLEKKTINFGWNRLFVVITARDVVFAVDESSNVCDRIALSEIEKVVCLGNDGKKGGVEEAECSATQDDLKKNLPPELNTPSVQKPRSQALFTKVVHENIQECVLEIFTTDGGFNDGRVSSMRAANQEEALSWTQTIQELAQQEAARCKAANEKTLFERVQISAKKIYEHNIIQMGSAAMVGINFVIMALQFEMMPSKHTQEPDVKRAFDAIEYAFTVVFALELCLNMVAYWFKEFWSDIGNVMDFVVVLISILSIFLEDLPGVSLLRLIRIFRVVRVFKKLESLRILVMALASALLPVCNAFFMLFIVAAMYSIVAVMFWSDLEGFQDLFGRFTIALLTMCQVASGDGWVTDVLKPMLKYEFRNDAPIIIFFFSFYLICGIVMLNVVVAVLLDEFINTVSQIKESKNTAVKTARDSVLDPVLAQVVGFTTTHDLTSKIGAIFSLLDSDNNGALSYKEFAAGLRRLTHKLERPVNITPGDFDAITAKVGGGGVPSGGKDEKWLDENGCLNSTNFEMIIRQQLAMYIQRQISFGVKFEGEKDGFSSTAAVLQGLKLLIVNGESGGLETGLTEAPGATGSAGAAGPSVEGRLRVLESQQDMCCAKQNQISEQLARISAQLEMSLEISQSILQTKHGFRIPTFTPVHTCTLPTSPSGVEESCGEPVGRLPHSPMPPSGSTSGGLDSRLRAWSGDAQATRDVQAAMEPKEMQEPAASLNLYKWTHGTAGEGGVKSIAAKQGTGNFSPQIPLEYWLTQYSTRRSPGIQDAETRVNVNTSDFFSLPQRTLEKQDTSELDSKNVEKAIQNLRETVVMASRCSPAQSTQANTHSLSQANTPYEALPESPDCITNLGFPSERALMPVYIPKDS